MRKVFIRTPYNYDMDEVSDATGTKCEDVSLAKQSFADDADINTIVRRFGVSGELPSNVRMPTYGDFTDVKDFKSAMDAVALARESFDAMPAEIRARFKNDPQAFVDFCSDEANREEATKLGLIDAKAAAAHLASSGAGALTAEPAKAVEHNRRATDKVDADAKPKA